MENNFGIRLTFFSRNLLFRYNPTVTSVTKYENNKLLTCTINYYSNYNKVIFSLIFNKKKVKPFLQLLITNK